MSQSIRVGLGTGSSMAALRDVSNVTASINAAKPPAPLHFPTTTTMTAPSTARGVYNFSRPSAGRSSCDATAPVTARLPSSAPPSNPNSPQADRRFREDPCYTTEYIGEIVEHFLQRERELQRDANYLSTQPEINERMRTILVDWLVDVHLKFKLHPETFYLAVDVVDRFLSVEKGTRATLQLVGITSMLLAAKYEEIWPPEVKECVYISANTYTRDDILRMENKILATLQFRLTTPTPYPILARLLDVIDADAQTRHTANFFLEHAVMDYKHLNFYPSQLAYASLYLANLTLHKPEPWGTVLAYYSKSRANEFASCTRNLLEFTASVNGNTRYQAIRRKYSSLKYSEVSRLTLPDMLDV